MTEQSKSGNNRLIIFVGIIALALVAVGAFILLTQQSGAVTGAKFDYSQMQASRTEDGGFLLGDPNAPVTVVEFADFQCPHCQDYTAVSEQVIRELVMTGKANFEYRLFPTVDRAAFTPRLVECAAQDDPAQFWAAHDLMFDLNKRGWSQDSSQEFARTLGLNYNDLIACIDSAEQWRTDVAVGQASQVTGTPAIRLRIDGQLQPIGPNYVSGGPSFAVIAAAVEAFQVSQ